MIARYVLTTGAVAAHIARTADGTAATRSTDERLESGTTTMKQRFGLALSGVVLVVAFAARGEVASAQSLSRAEAFRFLNQATFGPTRADIDALIALGHSKTAYRRWINRQVAIAPSLVLPVVQQAGTDDR